MGDRGNITLQFDDTDNRIYLYTHWSGSELGSTLQAALKRGRGRWGDDSYLARIIFSEMIQDDVLSDTGYGLSPYAPDNSHNIFNVNLPMLAVEITTEGGSQLESWDFESFVALENPDSYL